MKVRLVGDKKLVAKLRKNMDLTPVRRIVQTNGNRMNKAMKKNTQTAFQKGYTQGTTARSINTLILDNGLTVSVGPTTEYAGYVEYGTRYMEPEPFIKPAFETQSKVFVDDLKRIVE